MKKLLPFLKINSIKLWIFALFLIQFDSNAQCGWRGVLNNGTVTAGCNAFGATVDVPSTSYRQLTVVNGVNYSVSTCGGAWDSQLTGFNGTTFQTGTYNDDNGPSCNPSNNASFDWTSTYDGTLNIQVERFNCGSTWPGTSTSLQVRQNTTVTNTTSTTTICVNSTKALTATLGGTHNNPTIAWSIVSGGGSIAGTTYTPTTAGSKTIRATVGVCSSDVTFTVDALPTTSNAGSDQTGASTCGLTSVTLAANNPTVGTGAWSIISGAGGTVTTPSSPTSTFSGTAGTAYTLRWTISNSTCPASTDDVNITFNRNPTTSAAGLDQTGASTCGLTTVTLASNTPTVGTGAWSIISGAGGTITTPSSPTSTFNGTAGTAYTLRWTISNSPCPASTDDVNITFNQIPTTALAGPDQTGAATCGLTTVTMAGNTPTVGTGIWGVVSGIGGSFGAPSSPTSTFSGTAGSTYILRWSILNSPCSSPTDDLLVTFNQNSAVGAVSANQDICNGASPTDMTIASATGTIQWQRADDAAFTVNVTNIGTNSLTLTSAQVGPLSATRYFRATVTNGVCSPVNSAIITVNVLSPSSQVVLAGSSVATAIEQCTESGWTYYGTSANPNDWVFAINKNGNTFTASVDVTVSGSVFSSINTATAGFEHGSYLMPRYWNVTLLTGSITTTVGVRFFYNPTELSDAQSARDAAWAPYSATASRTALRWFKSDGVAFNASVIAGIDGNSFNNFPNIDLSPSSGTINGVTYAEFNGITSFSGGTAGYGFSSPGAGLPVKLTSFTAQAIDNSYIRLDWATALEIDNRGFEIERSEDGINFTTIGWKDGNGNSTEPKYYGFDDKTVSTGTTYYYRLKQIDFDGDSEYSNIVSSRINGKDEFTVSDFIPTEVKGNTKLEIFTTNNRNINISVFNTLGQPILSRNESLTVGNNKIEFSFDDLPAGTYMSSIKSNNEFISRKFVVIR